jgi:GNAT superfamily N-acetyltransferase
VRPELHRRGVGRALVGSAEEWCGAEGVQYLQVKTLGPSAADEGYQRTRAFYFALGFVPLEETTAFWGERQPALILVKHLVPM